MMQDEELESTDESEAVIISETHYGQAVLEHRAGYIALQREVIIEPQYFRRVAEWFAKAADEYDRRTKE